MTFWRPAATVRRPRSSRPGGPGLPARALAGAALAATVAIGCSAAAPAPPSTSSTALPPATAEPTKGSVVVPLATRSPGCDHTTGTTPRSTQTDVTLRSSNLDRTYKQHIPAAAGAAPAPLVIDLHGYLSGAAGQAAMSDLATTSERAGFVLVTPQGNGALPYWNAVPHAELPDDVQFVSDIIDDVAGRLCIDPTRVYVDGLSNGAFLTSLVACRLADKVAAVATVAGLLSPADCAPARPIPILAIHGTADQFVTYDGSPNVALATLAWNPDSTKAFEGLPFAPVTETLATWAAREGCTEPPEQQPVRGAVTVTRYHGCRGGSTIELYSVAGGGHTWPGSAFSQASGSVLGPTTTDVNANDLIWSFFESHPMPAR